MNKFFAVCWMAKSTAAVVAMIAVVFFDWAPDQKLVNVVMFWVAMTVTSMKADTFIAKFLR